MKVFQVITLSENAGAQRYIDTIVRYSQANHEYVIVAAPGGSGFHRTNCRKIYLDSLVRAISPRRDVQAYGELVTLFTRERPDVVHCHSSKAGILARLAARKAGVKKIIYTAHGFVFKEPLHPLLKMVYYVAEKWMAGLTDVLICVSREDYAFAVKKKFKAKKIIYIPNGIDLKNYTFKKRSIKTKNLKGICAANFYKTKGHEVLLEALRAYGVLGENISIDFAGGFGPEREWLEYLVEEYGLTERIKFIGYRTDLPKLLPEYDFFILPSLKEGFPYVVLEALASGLPVIATRTGGIPDIVKHLGNGYLCRPGSVKDLEIALNHLICGDFKLNKGFLSDYAIQKIVARIEDTYL